MIKSWIEKYFVEFDNKEFEHTFEEFIKGPVSEIEGEQYANALMSSFTTKVDTGKFKCLANLLRFRNSNDVLKFEN